MSASSRLHTPYKTTTFKPINPMKTPPLSVPPPATLRALSANLRGDARVEFRWRLNGIGHDTKDPLTVEDGLRGVQGWYPGSYWAGAYPDWHNETRHGVRLLFRGGTPNARAVRCTSDIVPVASAGQSVTFAIPLHVTLGTEAQLSVALRIIGQGEEIIVLSLYPGRQVEISGGMFKAHFYTLRVNETNRESPSLSFTGVLHLRVYPLLLNYGGRMIFEFNSNTKHMDVESSLFVGSLWHDLAHTDVRAEWDASGLSEESIATAREKHNARLAAWSAGSAELSQRLRGAGRVEVSCACAPRPWDRGETRVQAYTGNPAKDVTGGEPNHHCVRMAEAVTTALGCRFSLFRYQQWQPVVQEEHPDRIDPVGWGMLEQWLTAAERSADQVMLNFYLDAFLGAYLRETENGTRPLPPEGVPGHTWDHLRTGYITALREARRVCPRLRIVQMQYEFDNFANTECHRDAHYRLFAALYEAVAEINRDVQPDQQLQVAGLGINTPTRWDFIDGFLLRYVADTDPRKRLDYLTWHTYLFPGSTPNIMQGFRAKLNALLAKHGLPPDFPVIVDEVGLAEPSTIEDLSGLDGASRKEAAMACFTAALHDGYLREGGNFIPVSGGGWHFGCLTYGRQSVLSPYAKGMILRSRLANGWIDSSATPRDPATGYGLYSFATCDDQKVSVLVWTVSPGIFLSDALPLRFPKAELVVRDLPEHLRNGPVRVTIQTSDPEQEPARSILTLPKCQTLPISRGATERYAIDFTPEEVTQLNAIPEQVFSAMPNNGEINLSLDVREHGMVLVTLERGQSA